MLCSFFNFLINTRYRIRSNNRHINNYLEGQDGRRPPFYIEFKRRNSFYFSFFISSSSSLWFIKLCHTQGSPEKKGLMDCSICTSMPVILRPPRNTICGACYEGARSIISLINKLESEKARNGPPNSCKASSTFMFLIVA